MELKPCPFCGCNLTAKHAGWFDHPKGECVLSGRPFNAGFIWQWNQRADLPPTLSAALTVPEVKVLVDAANTILAELRANKYASDHMPEGSRVALSAALRAIEGATDE